MNEKDFDLLVESIKQAGEIKRGERKPSRVFQFSPLDGKAIRSKLQQSQREFAQMIGVSVAIFTKSTCSVANLTLYIFRNAAS